MPDKTLLTLPRHATRGGFHSRSSGIWACQRRLPRTAGRPLRRNPLINSGVISLSTLIRPGLTASAVDQLGQRQQVGRGERATARGEDHERIYRRDIGPGRRQGEQHAVLVVQVNSVLAP